MLYCHRTFIVGIILAVPSIALSQANWLPSVDAPPQIPAVPGAESGSISNPGNDDSRNVTDTIIGDTMFSLLPPANPNLLFGNDARRPVGSALSVPNMGMEGGLPVIYGAATVAAQAAMAYDSGYVGSGIRLFPSTVALDGTNESRRRGRTQLSAEATQLAVTLSPAAEAANGVRADFQLDFFDGVQLRLAKGQIAIGNGILYGGKTWTTFMDEYAVPTSISLDTTSAGAPFRRLAQIGYSFPIRCSTRLKGFVAIEEPTSSDFSLVDATDERIERYPTIVGRLHWANCRDWRHNSTVHLAGLLRGMGREDTAFREDFEAGWGVSLMAKFRPFRSHKHTFYAGGVVGDGIGNYLFGLSHHSGPTPTGNMPAAVPVMGKLEALRNYGAHAGYTRHWNDASATNFGYGYAFAESESVMPATTTRMLQNAWVNHQVKLSELLAVGVEYHYAYRDVRDRTEGDNHRMLFVVQLLTN